MFAFKSIFGLSSAEASVEEAAQDSMNVVRTTEGAKKTKKRRNKKKNNKLKPSLDLPVKEDEGNSDNESDSEPDEPIEIESKKKLLSMDSAALPVGGISILSNPAPLTHLSNLCVKKTWPIL
jgi:hypothetical protein